MAALRTAALATRSAFGFVSWYSAAVPLRVPLRVLALMPHAAFAVGAGRCRVTGSSGLTRRSTLSLGTRPASAASAAAAAPPRTP